jgi:DNA invertase Pin-like site-specific DNA recombinase
VKENLRFTGDKSNPTEELLLNLLASVYQFERAIILERQREGIAKAKQRGVYRGRRATIDKSEIMRLLDEGFSMRKVAEMTNTSLSTVTRAKAEFV